MIITCFVVELYIVVAKKFIWNFPKQIFLANSTYTFINDFQWLVLIYSFAIFSFRLLQRSLNGTKLMALNGALLCFLHIFLIENAPPIHTDTHLYTYLPDIF